MMRVAILFNDDAQALAAGEAKDRIAVAGAGLQAQAVARALTSRGAIAVAIPVRADILEAMGTLRAAAPDVVFNACESFAGRARGEGAVAGLLELLGFPFTGSPPAALYLAQDKARCKAVLRAAGVPVAPGGVLASPGAPLPDGLRFPAFLKTRFEDASHGITVANVCADEPALRRRAAELLAAWKQDVLVEEFLPGRELNVALLDGDVLPISEIDYAKMRALGHPPVVTYDAKWVKDSPDYRATPVICPAALDEALRATLARIARAAWDAIGCRGYARVDIRLDGGGRPVVLEVNPNPDISPDAGFARSARQAGMDHADLIDRIVRAALQRGPARGDAPPGPPR